MKRRSAEILRRLLDAPTHSISLDTIYEDYRISEKTLRSDVLAISSFIQAPDGRGIVAFLGGRLSLVSGVDTSAISEILDEMDLYEYRLSSEERKAYIIVSLIMNQGTPCSMQSLADEMYVTRNTVISDCKLAGDWLNARGVEMRSRGKLGVSVDVGRDVRDRILIDIFADLLHQRRHRHDFFSNFVARMLGYHYSVDVIVALMRTYQSNQGTIIAREVEYEIAACLMVLLNSLTGSDEKAIDINREAGQDFVGNMVCFVSTGLKPPCRLASGDVDRIKCAIMGRDLLPQIKGMNDFDLYCAISHFLLLVAADLGVDIQNDELLIESLLSHVKSMVEWSSDVFEVNVSQPSGVMVGMVEHAALPHFHVLESYLRRPMNRSMRSSVIIHICAALYRAQEAASPARVVITCPGSMATSTYLEAQVRNYFRFEVVETTAVLQLNEQCLAEQGVELIISSVPISGLSIPVIQVSPMLTVEDVNRIQAWAFQLGRGERGMPALASCSTLARLQDIYESGSSKKITYLDMKISSILDGITRSENLVASYSLLISMLSRDHIRIEKGSPPWRRAIELAAESLLRDGFISSSYVQRAIENVEEYGSYIVVNDGIALAHGSHDDGVFQDGLGLLLSREGILFDSGERVRLLFFFCQQSETDYLGLFKEIIRLGNEPADMNRLLLAETPQEVQHILIELLTSYVESPGECQGEE